MTLNEIIYRIKETFTRYNVNDDSKPSDSLLINQTNSGRATLIRRDLDQNINMNQYIFQSYKIEFEKVDSFEDCDINSDCFILRSVEEIPQAVRLKDGEAIFIYAMDTSTPLTRISFDRANYISYQRYTKNQYYWFTRNNRIYIIGPKFIQFLKLRMIFTNPLDAKVLCCECVENKCLTPDDAYPFPDDMVDQLEAYLFSTIYKNLIPSNTINDNNAK